MTYRLRRVSATELQRLFNEGLYRERVLSGELREQILDDRPANRHHEPPGTRSQAVAYFDSAGNKVAVVHQYKRPDGSLGAWGRPDPKYLRIGDEILKIDPSL